MEIQSPITVNNERFLINVNESIQSIILKVMYENTAENLHNLLAGHNCLVNISIKNRGSVERNICNNIPALRLMQFSQYKKGYYNYAHHNINGTQYIGLTGIIDICEVGGLKMLDGDYLEILITNLPNGTRLSMTGKESDVYSNHYMMYERGGIPANKPQEVIQLNDNYDTVLLSTSQTIEREYNQPNNSYANPFQKIQLYYADTQKPNMSMTKYDLAADNVVQNGNDIVAIWTKSDINDGAKIHPTAVYPPFFAAIDNTTDVNGFYAKHIILGYDDFQLLDVENVDTLTIYKNADFDYPYFTEKKVLI